MFCESGHAQPAEFIHEVQSFNEILHAMDAGASQVDESLTARHKANANIGIGCNREPAQLHEPLILAGRIMWRPRESTICAPLSSRSCASRPGS